jgi:oligopeptide/dipeptide ABC transporter ATP-binding protein
VSLLQVSDLRVSFATEEGTVQAVDGVTFSVDAGETLGIVGESGCGKSVTAMTLLGLTQGENASISGRAEFEGSDLLAMGPEELRQVRGDDVAMIFQDPLSSLHPFYKVGDQLTEAIRTHRPAGPAEAEERAIELLDVVGVPEPSRRIDDYPHEFSGGMRQRAMIAMALANDPKLLIADEPTTALDVTTQAQILQLIMRLQESFGMAVIMITHDLGVIAEVADRVLVMYAGRIVEEGSLEDVFYDPQHPYTWGLLGSLTRLDRARSGRLAQIAGSPPSLIAAPQGCHFRPRCPHEFDRCTETPPLEDRAARNHPDRCWLEPDQKRRLRVVDGRIGLGAKAAPEEEQATPAPAAPDQGAGR